MLVLGIDPGSTATGFAAVQRRAGRYHLLEAGVIRTNAKQPIPTRLKIIYDGLIEVLERVQPETCSIEAIFRHRSSESALRLGQARGVALLAVAQCGLEVTAYNPMTVKKSVGGHGGASKEELSRVVCRLVGRAEPLPSDASDATAIAITHIINHSFNARVQQATQSGPGRGGRRKR